MRSFCDIYTPGNPILILGVDPGPASSALCLVRVAANEDAKIEHAAYLDNKCLGTLGPGLDPFLNLLGVAKGVTALLCYESCGAQGAFVGESTFETAAMGGEIRFLFRSHVEAIYQFRPSDWRYLLCGQGNARTPQIYAECCRAFGTGAGGGSDPYRGIKSAPGQLAALYEAGKGNNMEHMKDALGVALALTRCVYRTGKDPEKYRRQW